MTSTLSLKDKAYAMLKDLILNEQVPPGVNLTEQYFVELLQMSRTPIRAAMERLAAEGLITLSPNKGMSVTELTLDRIVDFFDIRAALEGYMVRKLVSRLWTEAEKSWFEENLGKQKRHMEDGDIVAFTRADADFHRQLAYLYGNQEIVQTMDNLQDKLFRVAARVLRKDGTRIVKSYEDHRAILDYLLEGRSEDAFSRMDEHLEFGKRILIM